MDQLPWRLTSKSKLLRYRGRVGKRGIEECRLPWSTWNMETLNLQRANHSKSHAPGPDNLPPHHSRKSWAIYWFWKTAYFTASNLCIRLLGGINTYPLTASIDWTRRFEPVRSCILFISDLFFNFLCRQFMNHLVAERTM